jgi:hypothetical protein
MSTHESFVQIWSSKLKFCKTFKNSFPKHGLHQGTGVCVCVGGGWRGGARSVRNFSTSHMMKLSRVELGYNVMKENEYFMSL